MTFAQISPGAAVFLDANSLIYHFTSDGRVPEPSSIIMLSLGVLVATGYGWRRHRARVA